MDQSTVAYLRKAIPKTVGLQLAGDGQLLTMTFHEPYQPIRNKSAAFESWILLAHLKSPRTKILMKLSKLSEQQIASLSYGQFLYRLSRFSNMGYGWFLIEDSLAEQVRAYVTAYLSADKVFRAPHNGIAGARDKGERILLTKFSSDLSILHALPECESATLHTDLPLELSWAAAKEDQADKNRVFPGNSNHIDLWCVKDDTLSIFSLSYQSPTVDLVSRLFFYANLCRDVFVDPAGSRIAFPPSSDKYFRGFGDFYEGEERRPIKCVNASFLSDDFYSGLDVEFICEMFTSEQIHFHMLKYSCEMPLAFAPSEP